MAHDLTKTVLIGRTTTNKTYRLFRPGQDYGSDILVQATTDFDAMVANSPTALAGLGTLDRVALCTFQFLVDEGAPNAFDGDACDTQIDVVDGAVVITVP